MVATNINQYLVDNGIKKTWLAERLGVPTSTLSTILNGRVEMRAEMFIRICRILRVSPETFAKEVEDEHRKDA